jgi:hypothetical protein
MRSRQPVVPGRSALRLGAVLLYVACAPVSPPEAAACGRLVGFYLGVPAPIEVMDFEAEVETGKVRIDYRTTDAMNVPLEGVALCRFRQSPDGVLEATDAFVDENRLLEQEIAAFNASESPS